MPDFYYGPAERRQIMRAIHRHNASRDATLERMTFKCGSQLLPRPEVRRLYRNWAYDWWHYLISEHERLCDDV